MRPRLRHYRYSASQHTPPLINLDTTITSTERLKGPFRTILPLKTYSCFHSHAPSHLAPQLCHSLAVASGALERPHVGSVINECRTVASAGWAGPLLSAGGALQTVKAASIVGGSCLLQRLNTPAMPGGHRAHGGVCLRVRMPLGIQSLLPSASWRRISWCPRQQLPLSSTEAASPVAGHQAFLTVGRTSFVGGRCLDACV